jgi:hypothetical protein
MNWKLLFLTALSIAVIVSCKKNSEDTSEEGDDTTNVSIQSLSEASSHATATEGGTSAISTQIINSQLEILEEETQAAKKFLSSSESTNAQGYISPQDRVSQLATACKYSSRTCSSGTGTIDWNGCTITSTHGTIAMTGGWTETWTDPGSCVLGYLASGTSVTRSSTGSVVNFAGGATITTDTAGGTAYDGTVFASGGVLSTRASGVNRTIAMTANAAIHKVFKGRRGTTLFDYYTVPSLTISGTKTNGTTNGLGTSSSNRALSGTVTLYHNLAKYTATNTFTSVSWTDANCCFPTSGAITTSFTGTGAPTGPVTLTFGSTCGSATYTTPTDTIGTTVALTNCQ